jgi:hypothetical protein
MLLSDGDRVVIIAALKFSATHWGQKAEAAYRELNRADAAKFAAFSGECQRLVKVFETGK